MERGAKRDSSTSTGEVRGGNAKWWQSNPMTYDWHGERTAAPLSSAWFEAMDKEFLGAVPYVTREKPFDRLIPYDLIRDRQVLEIGCGMGLHSQLMAAEGARVTSIDLTDYAVTTTARRFSQVGRPYAVCRMDGEQLAFGASTFDFVWSWGVIHHCPSTAAIVREIARVLRPGGECRVMVYHREGLPALLDLARGALTLDYPRRTFDEILWRHTDGFHARYYSVDQFEDLFRPYFEEVQSLVTGQQSDGVPLPRRLRRVVAPWVPMAWQQSVVSRFGGFLVVTARRPKHLRSTPR